jgi:hypothetical protein
MNNELRYIALRAGARGGVPKHFLTPRAQARLVSKGIPGIQHPACSSPGRTGSHRTCPPTAPRAARGTRRVAVGGSRAAPGPCCAAPPAARRRRFCARGCRGTPHAKRARRVRGGLQAEVRGGKQRGPHGPTCAHEGCSSSSERPTASPRRSRRSIHSRPWVRKKRKKERKSCVKKLNKETLNKRC